MKQFIFLVLLSLLHASCIHAQTDKASGHLYLDIHRAPSGKIKFTDVMAAHQQDLAVQKRYGVSFLKFWVDENKGLIYCLSIAPDTNSILATHQQAHGLLPSEIMNVKAGVATQEKTGMPYFMDIHELGAGKVKAADVAAAHEKDLKVQSMYGVHFINYWVDEKSGKVLCLSQAQKMEDVIETHKKAHGLVPGYIAPVQQGQ